MKEGIVIRVRAMTQAELRLVNSLSPDERKMALLGAARAKLIEAGVMMVDEGNLLDEAYEQRLAELRAK